MQILSQRRDQLKQYGGGDIQELKDVSQELKDKEAEYKQTCRYLLKLLLDCPTALACMELISPKVGGIAGTLASLISLYEIWGSDN